MANSNPWFPIYVVLRIRYVFGGLRGTLFDVDHRIKRSCKLVNRYERTGKLSTTDISYLIDSHHIIETALRNGHIHTNMDSKIRTLLRVISNVISKVK